MTENAKTPVAYFIRKQVQAAFANVVNELISTEEFWADVDQTFSEEVKFGTADLIFDENEPMASIADTGIQWCEHLEIRIQVEDYTYYGGPYEGDQEAEVRKQIENIDKLQLRLSEARAKLATALENVKKAPEKSA